MSSAGQTSRQSDIHIRARLRRALEEGNEAAAVEIARTNLPLMRELADNLIKEVNPQLSMAARRVAVAAAPDDPVVHRDLMRSLIIARKPEAAVAHVASTAFSDGERRKLFVDLADDFVAERRPRQALAALEAMQASWPLDSEAKRVLLKAEIQLGSPDAALARLEQSGLPAEDRALLLRHVAAEFEAEGKRERMLECRRAAALAMPQDVAIVTEYARALIVGPGGPSRVVEALRSEAGLATADRSTVLRELAGEAERRADKSGALTLLRGAAELAPHDVTAVKDYIRVLVERQGFEAALAELDGPAFDAADRVQVLRDLGGHFAGIRREEPALRCKEEAYRRAPSEFGPTYELATAILSRIGPEGLKSYLSSEGRTIGAVIDVLVRLEAYLIERKEQTVSRDCSRIIILLSPDDAIGNATRIYSAIDEIGYQAAFEPLAQAQVSEAQRAAIKLELGRLAQMDENISLVARIKEST